MVRKIASEDLHVPSFAHEVPKGYPVSVVPTFGWDLVAHIYAPMVPSPRPRVTTRGTFMPTDYKKHCTKLGASLAYARGIVEATANAYGNCLVWQSGKPFKLQLSFWSSKQRGDLDNCAKTVMDSAQLHRGEPGGAELWKNDSQIHSLLVEWLPTEGDDNWEQIIVSVKATA
jgi:Holliday junction resolvase RusA-like endonuclease